MKDLHIATSPLTGTIFCGYLLKNGRVWAAGKQDKTIEALSAVAEHALLFKKMTGENIILSGADGKPEFEIIVNKFKHK